jgi:hypothetical protein
MLVIEGEKRKFYKAYGSSASVRTDAIVVNGVPGRLDTGSVPGTPSLQIGH